MFNGNSTLGRGQIDPIDNYKKSARVWVPDPETVWIGGELVNDVTISTWSVIVRLDDGKEVSYVRTYEQLPFLQNPKVLLGTDDLTELSFLHEPAVLHNLQYRFLNRHQIYTYCGIVLVAINPYADCSQIYGDEIIQAYRGAGKDVRRRDPHIYAVAEEAFYDLKEYGKNQSIIVSGESGAGKTVSAKHAMKYLASIAQGKKGTSGIEKRVLASNPIMEAIGNAKTVRNDNSSRFGKYVQVNFGKSFAINGAEMKTYLLEKSRIVYQSRNERNYHIFYQLCRSRDHPLLKQFHLRPCETYTYTNQGGDSRIPGVDDHTDFLDTVKALTELGFSEEHQKDIMRTLVGILSFGNVEFAKDDDATHVLEAGSHELKRICEELFGVSQDALTTWLTNREIRTGRECVRKPLSGNEATRSRDALVKLLYASLFDWVVNKINDALRGEKVSLGHKPSFIGVLDIYGFETFDVNSFEQFCINYANEKLQYQFNQYVFKLEQDECFREEIKYERTWYNDNQAAVVLIENNPGLISLLDEQCKMPRGSDRRWLRKTRMDRQLIYNRQLQSSMNNPTSFIVKHFAADVSYEAIGFMEKNKDAVNGLLLDVVRQSKFAFLGEILSGSSAQQEISAKVSKKTVAGDFRKSLSELTTVLALTRPHYVRCIKPNDSKEEFYFEPKRVIQQLRAYGVVDTLCISAQGFPSRWKYQEFARRYRVLYSEGGPLWKSSPKEFARATCSKHLVDEQFAIGKTMVFFRTGQVAILERLRLEVLNHAAVAIQSQFKGYLARRKYQKLRDRIIAIQNAILCDIVRRHLQKSPEERAAIKIQTAYRSYIVRKKFVALKSAALAIQNHFGGRQARLYVQRIEDRSVGHLQKLNSGLENKIIQLQQRLDSVVAEKNELASLATTVEMLQAHILHLEAEREHLLQSKLEVERLETECDVKEAEKAGLQSQISQLTNTIKTLGLDHMSAIQHMEETLKEKEKAVSELQLQSQKAVQLLVGANAKRAQAEKEVVQMKEQLLANANLLASPSFSREGSIRREGVVSSTSTTSFNCEDIDDLTLIMRQQKSFSDLRTLNEKYTREIELLRTLGGSKDLDVSMDTRNSQLHLLHIQELERMNQYLRADLGVIVAEMVTRGYEHTNVQSIVERLFSENDRLREEYSMLRALLHRIYEDSFNDSPRPDSGIGRDTHSEAGSFNLDAAMCLDRQNRQFKTMADQFSSAVYARYKNCEEFERRLAGSRPSEMSFSDDGGRGAQSHIRYLAAENMTLTNKLTKQSDELKEMRGKSSFGPFVVKEPYR